MSSTITPFVKLRVLISGAGIAGPCLAYWLSKTRHDISVTIVERSSVPRPTGQAIDIRGRAIEVVKKMGLLEKIQAFNTTEVGTVFLDAAGKVVAKLGVDNDSAPTAELEILRADLSQLLLDATTNLSNVEYRYGDSVESIEQTSDNVRVTFAQGSKETFDVLVCADGATSRTKSMILEPDVLAGSYNFFGQYIAFFSIPSQASDEKLWKWQAAPKGLAIHLRPHRNPATMGAYLARTTSARSEKDPAFEEALDKGVEAQKQLLRKHFSNAGWDAERERVLKGMESSDDFYMSRIAQVKMPKWTNGRALVLGDAAYATMGVGTALAIEGAYYLAGAISQVQSNSDVPLAVKRYEEVFRPVVEKTTYVPSVFPQLFCPQSSWGLGIRNWILWIVAKSKLYTLFGPSKNKDTLPEYEWVGL